MKANKKYIGLLAAGLVLAGLTQSCVSDAPFANGEGEGTLRMKLVVNSDLTRAYVPTEALADNCIIYISNSRGLLYNFRGIDNIPPEIKLKTGRYVAEAWTGDSVTASWDDRFYRGYQEFDIQEQNENSVVVTCKIANVVVSLNEDSVMPELGDDWTLTVWNSRGSLEFNRDNMASAKAYFMMPNADIAVDEDGNYIKDDPGFTKYTNLKYKIEGTNQAGKHFEKSGDIGVDGGNIVQHAHEYRLTFQYHPEYEETGGSFITIIVSDQEMVVESEVGIYSKPAIKGQTFDIQHQIQGSKGAFGDEIVKVSAFNGIKSLQLIPEDGKDMGVIPGSGIDLKQAVGSSQEALKNGGVNWDEKQSQSQKDLYTSYITFSKAYMNTLPERDEEYRLAIHVVDGNGRENTAVVRIAVGEGALVVDDLVALDDIDTDNNPLAVLSNKVTLSGQISDDASNTRIMYRKASGNGAWTTKAINATRASVGFSVTLDGLEPGTEYVYKAVADEWEGKESRFTTEGKFEIPYANMEKWGIAKGNNAIKFPGEDYANQFWDSGNHGSAMMSVSLTQGSTVMHNSGSYSAELKSQKVGIAGGLIGKFAAGNLFVGTFGATIGTDGAMLTFGQKYNGSHPSALTVYASYTPVKMTAIDKSCPNNPATGKAFTTNDWDQGQIYVALATGPIQVNTGNKESNGVAAGTFMNFNDPRILAFGEKTWADGDKTSSSTSLDKLTIPIKWRKGAETKKPTHLIIVCSASKYGDYFTGGAGSVMYLDDFELEYGDLQFE